MDNELQQLAQITVVVLSRRTPDEVVEFIRSLGDIFCPHCGKAQNTMMRCQCENDE